MSEQVDEPPPWPAELTLTTGPAANGGSCVARHEGRVVFVRYALPGETVKVRVGGGTFHGLQARVVGHWSPRICAQRNAHVLGRQGNIAIAEMP